MPPTYDELVSTVRTRMGGATEKEAVAAIHATLSVLAECLKNVDANAVSDVLPEPFSSNLRDNNADVDHDLGSFYSRVAAREGVSYGYAIEHAQAVCRALMLHTDEQTRSHLSIDLWPELLRPDLTALPPATPGKPGHTLANGRPGSRHPLSEEAPPARVQSESVVAADNPHGARKLSSGHAEIDAIAEHTED